MNQLGCETYVSTRSMLQFRGVQKMAFEQEKEAFQGTELFGKQHCFPRNSLERF